jgi:hypothetical protein
LEGENWTRKKKKNWVQAGFEPATCGRLVDTLPTPPPRVFTECIPALTAFMDFFKKIRFFFPFQFSCEFSLGKLPQSAACSVEVITTLLQRFEFPMVIQWTWDTLVKFSKLAKNCKFGHFTKIY